MNPATKYLQDIVAKYRIFYPKRQNAVTCLNSLLWDNNWCKVIDSGICFRVAELARELIPNTKIKFAWCTYLEEGFEDTPVHCFIEYNGRYYDTCNVEGVDTVNKLNWFIRNPTHYVSPDEKWDIEAENQYRYRELSPFIEYFKKENRNEKLCYSNLL